MKAILFDHSICNGCYGCQIACKDEHCGNEWMPYQKSQPTTGSFWMKLEVTTHGQVPRVRDEFRPVSCQHCGDPACIKANGDAFYKRSDGLVILDPEKAADKSLLDACPYGVIYWNDELGIAQKCNGCAHLIDAGEVPHCVDLCAFGALKLVDMEDAKDEIASAEQYHPEFGTDPHFYYMNMPHLFIGGGLYDPIDNEIVEGAHVALTSMDAMDYPGDKVTLDTKSDEFGDFWFRRIDPAKYTLTIEADGYKVVEKQIDLKESLSVGEIALERL